MALSAASLLLANLLLALRRVEGGSAGRAAVMQDLAQGRLAPQSELLPCRTLHPARDTAALLMVHPKEEKR